MTDRVTALTGRYALVSGLAAALLSALFVYLNQGFAFSPLDAGDVADIETLIPRTAVTLLFQYATPLLCVAAFAFGLPAIRQWSARIGTLAAGLSVITYLAFLRACGDAVTMAF